MIVERVRPLTAGALAALGAPVVFGAAVAVPWAAAGTPTCRGLPATHVGSEGFDLYGTDGADVLVTNGAVWVNAFSGDDVICATNVRGDTASMEIAAGEGDDVVDTTGNVAVWATVHLGNGDDTMVGGDSRDSVSASSWVGSSPEGTDTVMTGGADDWVTTGGDRSGLDGDTIDLGEGDDSIRVEGGLDGGAWTGGPGTDNVTFSGLHGNDALTIDNLSDLITTDDEGGDPFTSFEDFLFYTGGSQQMTFIGSPADETISSNVQLDEVRLGAGDDWLDLDPNYPVKTAAMQVRGGRGTDRLGLGDLHGRGHVDLDVPAGSFRLLPPARSGSTSGLGGFETFFVGGAWTRVKGADKGDLINWNACRGVIKGRGGADLIRYHPGDPTNCDLEVSDITIVGGRGRDRLLGGALPDRLWGGRGVDFADGGESRDLCRAEHRRNCERR